MHLVDLFRLLPAVFCALWAAAYVRKGFVLAGEEDTPTGVRPADVLLHQRTAHGRRRLRRSGWCCMSRLDDIRQRLEAADAQGGWQWDHGKIETRHRNRLVLAAVRGLDYEPVLRLSERNGDLIVHAPDDLRHLLAEVERLQDLAGAFAAMDPVADDREGQLTCLACGAWAYHPRDLRHTPFCSWVQASEWARSVREGDAA